MNQEKESRLSNSHNSFGTGFITGFLFAVLAIFFLATKKGRELAKEIDIKDFDILQLDEILKKEMGKVTKDESKDITNGEDEVRQPTMVSQENPTPTSSERPILGRRFFHRRK